EGATQITAQIGAHSAGLDVGVVAGEGVADRGLYHVLDVVEREPTGDRIGVERIEPRQLQDSGRAGAVDDRPRVRTDNLDELANGSLVHLRGHMIFPPSRKNNERRYLCIRSVGSWSYTVCAATLLMKSWCRVSRRLMLRWQYSATACQVGLPSVLRKSSPPCSRFSVCCTAASQIFFLISSGTTALLPRFSMPRARPLMSVPAVASV